MRKIIRIEHVEERASKDGEPYWITHAVTDDGTECEGYGKGFDLGDMVEVFYHEKYGKVKMRKGEEGGYSKRT